MGLKYVTFNDDINDYLNREAAKAESDSSFRLPVWWFVLGLVNLYLAKVLTQFLLNLVDNIYENSLIETENKKGRYGDTRYFRNEKQRELQSLKDGKLWWASTDIKMGLGMSILFVLCAGELVIIDKMSANLLNDTMLGVNGNTTEIDLGPIFETIGETFGQMFSPGLNLGFVLLIVLSIALHEHPATPMMGVFAAYVGGLVWMNNFSVWTFVISHWLKIVVYAVLYVIVGAAWTVPKWWIYVRKSKNHDRLRKDYDDKLNKRGRSTVISDEDRYNAALSIVGNNKYKFYTWMMWWPFNVIYTIARDPLTVLYNWLYAKLTNTFAKILLVAFDEAPKLDKHDDQDPDYIPRESEDEDDE